MEEQPVVVVGPRGRPAARVRRAPRSSAAGLGRRADGPDLARAPAAAPSASRRRLARRRPCQTFDGRDRPGARRAGVSRGSASSPRGHPRVSWSRPQAGVKDRWKGIGWSG